MAKTFKTRKAQAKAAGLVLDQEMKDGHPYTLSTGGPVCVKVWLSNLGDDFDKAFAALTTPPEGLGD